MGVVSNTEGRRRPQLRTWSAFGELGRRPSEYEIVTHKMNHTHCGRRRWRSAPTGMATSGSTRHRDPVPSSR